MAEELRITASLDTSKLGAQAKSGLNDISRQLNSIGTTAQRASKALDSVADSARKIGVQARASNASLEGMTRTVDGLGKLARAGAWTRVIDSLSPATSSIAEKAGFGTLASSGLNAAKSGIQTFAATGNPGFALAAAAASLYNSALEQEKAAQELMAAAEKTAKNALEGLSGFRESEELKGMIESGNISGIRDILAARTKEFQDLNLKANQFELSTIQARGDVAFHKGMGFGSLWERMQSGSPMAALMDTLTSLEEGPRAANRLQTAGEETIKATARLKSLSQEIETLTRIIKTLEDAEQREIQKEKERVRAGIQDEINETRGLMAAAESTQKSIEEVGSRTKLSDAMTRIGGTAGYGAQMTGMANTVMGISNQIKSILELLRERLTTQNQAYAATF